MLVAELYQKELALLDLRPGVAPRDVASKNDAFGVGLGLRRGHIPGLQIKLVSHFAFDWNSWFRKRIGLDCHWMACPEDAIGILGVQI
jgi:hypothetical protein